MLPAFSFSAWWPMPRVRARAGVENQFVRFFLPFQKKSNQKSRTIVRQESNAYYVDTLSNFPDYALAT